MNKINSDQLELLKEYKNYVDKIGSMMPDIAERTRKNINSTKDYHYILGIVFGTELIKTQLIPLIILYNYVEELKKILNTNNNDNYNITKMNAFEYSPYGTILNRFKQRYAEDTTLLDELEGLKIQRNKIVHEAVTVYKGNLTQVDKEIAPYLLTQILDTIIHKLVTLLNYKRKENLSLSNKIREAGLL